MTRLSNPFSFSRASVTIVVFTTYVALIAVLIWTQLELPRLPKSPTPIRGINLTEAWDDLQLLTAEYHPYNSRRNDFVHDWLIYRLKTIVRENNAFSRGVVYVHDDRVANLTSSTSTVRTSKTLDPGLSVYFEGTNIIVYVRGTDDDKSEWWHEPERTPSIKNGVLVNAHYDSVSTGYGSTDDGVGVITILQLIRYYTMSDHRPRNGLVFLLNNGEEDFLNGARAFSRNAFSNFVHTFLNLEGAGAGGRAALFRSTDEEVTSAYARSPYPYGTVVSGDAFEKGLVRSETDYFVFKGYLGYRGLDVAFIGPRARYHTDQDDSRHTGKKAIWHMLSSALATTNDLTSREAITPDDEPHRSIWFDLFGYAFVLLRAHTFFALSVSLLVVGPIILLVTLVFLHRADKLYLFSNSRRVSSADFEESVNLYGWRGCFRFPFILLFASAAPIALAYLLFKENEQIAHSSPWPVWAMMVSAFVFVAWFVARFADYVRPSALSRAYGYGWLTVAWWLILIAAVIYEEQLHLGGLYFALFYCASTGMATWLSYVELFSLPKKGKYCTGKTRGDDDNVDSRNSSRPPPRASRAQAEGDEGEGDADERTSLLPKLSKAISAEATDTNKADYEEQEWSKSQWNWFWVIQWLLLLPNVLIIGQLGLFLVDGLHQTGQDGGNNQFLVYLGIAIVTIFIFSPMVPVIHRITWHLPLFLLLVLIGTLLYNLLAFPFSAENRVKLYFQQEIDLNNGNNTVSLAGIQPFLDQAVSTIPSAAGNSVKCHKFRDFSRCSWAGIDAEAVPSNSSLSARKRYKTWMDYDAKIIAKSSSTRTARFNISGRNTRACKLVFDHPIAAFNVSGQGPEDERFEPVPKNGSTEIRLWSRTWDRTWTVDVSWNSEEYGKALSGKAVCLWSDVNQKGVIPAFYEAHHYVPIWVALSKIADGLVEGYKTFSL